MSIRSVPTGVCAFLAALILTVSSPLAQSSARSNDSLDALVFEITPDRLSDLLVTTGYSIYGREPETWTIVSPGDQLLGLWLMGCVESGCDSIRIRGIWDLGDRPAAISAARFYEQTVPIAFVSLMRIEDALILTAGRDVVLTPGRTLRNLLYQFEVVDQMSVRITDMLIEEDPGISEYWRQIRETENE